MGSASSSTTVKMDVPVKPSLRCKVATVLSFKDIAKTAEENKQTTESETTRDRKSSGQNRSDLQSFLSSMKKQKAEAWDSLTTETEPSGKRSTPDSNTSSEEFNRWKADREKMLNNEEQADWTCIVCNDFALFGGYKCRVCLRVYHTFCLVKCGKYTEAEMKFVDKFTNSSRGWACHWCENITSLLSAAEMQELFDIFDRCDLDKDHAVSLPEYLEYKRKRHMETLGTRMPGRMERKHEELFVEMDINGDGTLHWWEFLKYEALDVLRRKSKPDLVTFLTKPETKKAQKLFEFFDENGDGSIDRSEATKIYSNWYQCSDDPHVIWATHEQRKDNCFIELSSEDKMDVLREADENNDGKITWEEFLKSQAYYIIISRLNRASALKDTNNSKKGL